MQRRTQAECECCGYEHLHLHSHYSLLDGMGMPIEYANRAQKINQKFLCITDHGMMGAIPSQLKACDEINKVHGKGTLNHIFGSEIYINRHQIESSSSADLKQYVKNLDEKTAKEFKQYGAHLLAIVTNETGYKNLVQLTSWAWTKGFYHRPRINLEMLKKHKEGLIFTSCCYASEVGKAFDAGLKVSQEYAEECGFKVIEDYIAILGKENYFLEIMLLDFVKQKPYNQFIIKAKLKYGLGIILSCDTHYCDKEDSHIQHLLMMIQTKKTLADIKRAKEENGMADIFELQDTNLWMKSEDELNEKWVADYQDTIPYEIFCEAKRTTVEICNRAKGVQIDRSLKLPVIPDADDKLKEEIAKGLKTRGLMGKPAYLRRIKEEYSLITRKGFSSYFLLQKMITDEAKRICPSLLGWGNGAEASGAGRGSAVGSLICYLLGITQVDPIREDLLFSRFMSEARGGRSIVLEFKNIDPLPVEEVFDGN